MLKNYNWPITNEQGKEKVNIQDGFVRTHLLVVSRPSFLFIIFFWSISNVKDPKEDNTIILTYFDL